MEFGSAHEMMPPGTNRWPLRRRRAGGDARGIRRRGALRLLRRRDGLRQKVGLPRGRHVQSAGSEGARFGRRAQARARRLRPVRRLFARRGTRALRVGQAETMASRDAGSMSESEHLGVDVVVPSPPECTPTGEPPTLSGGCPGLGSGFQCSDGEGSSSRRLFVHSPHREDGGGGTHLCSRRSHLAPRSRAGAKGAAANRLAVRRPLGRRPRRTLGRTGWARRARSGLAGDRRCARRLRDCIRECKVGHDGRKEGLGTWRLM